MEIHGSMEEHSLELGARKADGRESTGTSLSIKEALDP